MDNKIMQNLEKYGQTHLLQYLDKVQGTAKDNLISQIANIDFEVLASEYKNVGNIVLDSNAGEISTIPSLDKASLSKEQLDRYYKIGKEEIMAGHIAVVTMAGGQGTRLGHNGPKGTYVLNVDGGKSLFEILLDRLKIAENEFGIKIHWYIMTSKANNDDTINFFESNNYFGYGKENISFFVQGEIAMLDESGRILMETPSSIKLAADGNGGIFEAMHKNGVIEEMKANGVQYVYTCGIDNVLANMVDPVLIGAMVESGLNIGTKSVEKTNPYEKAGIICMKNGHPAVIEYTEIPDSLATMRKPNGELMYCEMNFVSNIFKLDFLDTLKQNKLPFHVAHKKCDILNIDGSVQVANEPNAYKFEMFIFDIYARVNEIFVLRVDRYEEFAPTKNKEGEDSPETSSKLYNDYWQKMRKAVNGDVVK